MKFVRAELEELFSQEKKNSVCTVRKSSLSAILFITYGTDLIFTFYTPTVT